MKKSFQTTDFSAFKMYEFNREVINELNIKAIMAEMKVYGFDEWNPIIVSKTGYVADGQHRLEAARRLNIPVCVDQYDREFTVEDIKRMNKNRINWKKADFVHAEIENADACMLYKFIKDCQVKGITSSGAIRLAMAANHRDQGRNMKLGLSKEELTKANDLLKELLKLKEYIPASTNSFFIGAYLRAKDCENFKLSTFIQKLQKVKFTCFSTMIDLIGEIEEVYNFKNSNKITIDRKGIKNRR